MQRVLSLGSHPFPLYFPLSLSPSLSFSLSPSLYLAQSFVALHPCPTRFLSTFAPSGSVPGLASHFYEATHPPWEQGHLPLLLSWLSTRGSASILMNTITGRRLYEPIVNFRFRSYTAVRAPRRNGAETIPMATICRLNAATWIAGSALWKLRRLRLSSIREDERITRTKRFSRSRFNYTRNKENSLRKFITKIDYFAKKLEEKTYEMSSFEWLRT